MKRDNGEKRKKPLGEILLEKYIITQEMLDLALAAQKKDEGKYLGQIFLEMGISQEQLNLVLNYFQHRKKIGDILLEDKVIVPSQLQEALQKQTKEKNSRKPLGRILMELGYIDYEQYLHALAKHFLMQVVSLKDFMPSAKRQQIIGEIYALQNKVVVLEDGVEKLKVALSEPNLEMMEEIRRFARLGKRIEFYLTRSPEIEPCLDRLYSNPPH